MTVARERAKVVNTALRSAMLAVGLILARVDYAAAQGGQYNLMGLRTGSCAKWTASHRENENGVLPQVQLSWVLGFLSAVGLMGDDRFDPLRGVDADAVEAWIGNWCRAPSHVLESISHAAIAFRDAHPR